MMPICICELSFFDYFIRIGNLSIIVYFLLYFIENKFLVWLRKEEEWTVIDSQMLDTLFDNNEKTMASEEVPELEQQTDESVVEASEAVEVEETSEEAVDASEEALESEEAEEASEEATEASELAESTVEEAETEASKILDETEIVDLLMN